MTPHPPRTFVLLLVEDDPGDAALAKCVLKDWRHPNVVHHVADGLECLAFLRRQGEAYADAPRPDLILLDLNMPRLDGRDVLEALHADPGLADIPVVVMTTSDAEADIARSYALGANSFITKPVDFDRFQQVMQAIEAYWCKTVTLPRTPDSAL
ncbi:response regulator rcp1 [mine drainage metagenome]|uniref:Response regulator rcp1 n=1 Tax=mine drainage metagenome TaxID=410659 RepID=A0A1J5QXR1_9ZZZZ